MQARMATRRVSVATVLGVGRIGCAAGRARGHSRERKEETWSNSVEGSRG